MTVKIRLRRTGRRNRPCYRICAIESRNPRDGRDLEILGLYDPLAPRVEDQLRVKVDRVSAWLANGAQASETCYYLCKKAGVEFPTRTPRKRKKKRTENKSKKKWVRNITMLKAKKARREARVEAKKAAAAAAASSEEG